MILCKKNQKLSAFKKIKALWKLLLHTCCLARSTKRKSLFFFNLFSNPTFSQDQIIPLKKPDTSSQINSKKPYIRSTKEVGFFLVLTPRRSPPPKARKEKGTILPLSCVARKGKSLLLFSSFPLFPYRGKGFSCSPFGGEAGEAVKEGQKALALSTSSPLSYSPRLYPSGRRKEATPYPFGIGKGVERFLLQSKIRNARGSASLVEESNFLSPTPPPLREGERKKKRQDALFAGSATPFGCSLRTARKGGVLSFFRKKKVRIRTSPNYNFRIALKNRLIPREYSLETFHRSNQDTCLLHNPAVFEGDWVQSGDLLADCAASSGGELSLGKNILVAYMPWEGYNFEDAILISERLVFEDVYSSIHIERYDIEVRETPYGTEKITRIIPELNEKELEHLDFKGVAKLGSWIQEGDILVGRVTPINKKIQSTYKDLLYTILQTKPQSVRDSSLRAPRGLKGKIVNVQRFSDALISTPIPISLSLKSSPLVLLANQKQKQNAGPTSFESISSLSPTSPEGGGTGERDGRKKKLLLVQKNELSLGSDVLSSLPISRKIRKDSQDSKKPSATKPFSKEEGLASTRKQVRAKTPVKLQPLDAKKKLLQSKLVQEEARINRVAVYLAEKRKIQVGDKMAGRHGNKGIVSQILPRQDMPFLANGTPLDMVLNPLGVPSRMNVGQLYECLLGLAAKYLGEHYKIFPFDETYGPEASRSFVYSKLYEARKKTGSEWLFNPNCPGKTRLFDGRTGDPFDQSVTVGYAYMLKLVHLVDDKIHSRSTGPYSLVTQQPLRGRSKQGGQRLGEMEVWALEGYGAAFTLLEMLTIKSDDMTGRMTLWSNLILNKDISIGTPESFKVLVCELQALCLDIGIFRLNSRSKIAEIESLTDLP